MHTQNTTNEYTFSINFLQINYAAMPLINFICPAYNADCANLNFVLAFELFWKLLSSMYYIYTIVCFIRYVIFFIYFYNSI